MPHTPIHRGYDPGSPSNPYGGFFPTGSTGPPRGTMMAGYTGRIETGQRPAAILAGLSNKTRPIVTPTVPPYPYAPNVKSIQGNAMMTGAPEPPASPIIGAEPAQQVSLISKMRGIQPPAGDATAAQVLAGAIPMGVREGVPQNFLTVPQTTVTAGATPAVAPYVPPTPPIPEMMPMNLGGAVPGIAPQTSPRSFFDIDFDLGQEQLRKRALAR